MKRKLLFFIFLICTFFFFSCEKEKNSVDHLKPQASFQQEIYETEVDIPVKISPVIVNPGKEISYKWKNDGKELSTDSVLIFTPAEAKDYTITLSVTNEYGESVAQCAVKTALAPPYRNAVFLIDPGARGDNLGPGNPSQKVNGRLMAIKADGTFENDAFGKVNDGKKLGYLCMQPVVFNHKIYILADAGNDDFDKAELIIADALTLKFEKSFSFDIGYNKVTSLTIASEQKAYIGTGSQKLFSLDLTTGHKGADVEGLPRNFEGGILTPILKVNDKIYGVSPGAMESQICAINITTDEVSTATVGNNVCFLLNETDGRIVLLTEGMMDWGAKNLAIFSTQTYRVEGEEQTLPDNVFSAAAVSSKTKELFFHSKNNKGDIYRYNYETAKSSLFTSVQNVEFARLFVDNNANKLYYTYKLETGANQFKTLIYNLSDEVPAKPVGYSHTGLDAYYALVY